ncbi:hypothetical protein ACYOEI_01595 [Singulisphaera rosea]
MALSDRGLLVSGRIRMPRIVMGDPDVDTTLDTWAGGIEKALNVTVGPGLHLTRGPSGIHIALAPDQEFYARLSGSSSPYSYSEAYLPKTGTTWLDLPGARTGSDAHEFNDVPGLNGKVVRLMLLEDDTYGFVWVRQPTPKCKNVCVGVSTGCSGNAAISGASVSLSDGTNTFTCTTSGQVAAVTISNPGLYSAVPTVSFSGGGGSGAAAYARMGVRAVVLGSGGAGYTNGTNYPLGITGGLGSGATGLFDVVSGQVTNVRISLAGIDYQSPPTISFPGAGTGTGASATANLKIVSVVLTSFGSYTSAPTVSFSLSGGGSGNASPDIS